MIERLLALVRPRKSESTIHGDLCDMCGTPAGRGHLQKVHDEAVAAWRQASGLAPSEEVQASDA